MASISTLPEQAPVSGSVLAQAQALRRAGRHGEAISRLDEAMRSALRHDEVFAGLALALKARSQVHLLDDAGASLTVSLVPAALRRLNPKIDAHCRIVGGLVLRRRAHRRWKAGTPDLALVHAAIDEFIQARCAAENGIEHRLARAAELNQLYTQGLEAAIAGRSRQDNPRLVVAALQAEHQARDKTPMEDAASVAGLTIVADLAIGAGLQPGDLFGLCGAPAHRRACHALFGADPPPWPQALLCAATAPQVPIGQKARALVLGSRCLTRDPRAVADQRLVHAYQVHLTSCDVTLVHEPAPGLAEQLALLQRLCHRGFVGRRAFR